ncbi:peptidase family C78-domain-containing protein [Lyophyllum atratum]|nr:peptidase family C78-domain-containing protein [Lyophyllum atratum]
MSYTLRGGKINLDPEIQIVGTSFTANADRNDATISCAFCSLDLEDLSLPQREMHCEQHLQDDLQGTSLHIKGTLSDRPLSSPLKKLKASTKRILGTTRKEKQTEIPKDDDIFWYEGLPTSPPRNYTPGLIPLLKKALWTSHAQGATQRAALCYERSVHVSRGKWESWACGYRNFLMACVALMNQKFQPNYLPLLSEPISPGVRNLQAWIEDAWEAGFDKEGAKELKKLVDTTKWIGTADLWVAFIYRGIPAELVDFDLKNQPRGAEVVIDWIVEYFSPKLNTVKSTNIHDALRGASPIVVTDRMPLILQHDGHSRTIIGYEMSKNKKVTLLTFDPSAVLGKDMRNTAISSWSLASSSDERGRARKRPPSSPPAATPRTKRARSTSMGMTPLDDEEKFSSVPDSHDSRPQEASENGLWECWSRQDEYATGPRPIQVGYKEAWQKGIPDPILPDDETSDREAKIRQEDRHEHEFSLAVSPRTSKACVR